MDSEYLAALHSVQTVAEVLYVPAAHAVHAVVPVYPLLHTQAASLVLPAFDDESFGQAWHVASAVAAVFAEKECAGQGVHTPEPGDIL